MCETWCVRIFTRQLNLSLCYFSVNVHTAVNRLLNTRNESLFESEPELTSLSKYVDTSKEFHLFIFSLSYPIPSCLSSPSLSSHIAFLLFLTFLSIISFFFLPFLFYSLLPSPSFPPFPFLSFPFVKHKVLRVPLLLHCICVCCDFMIKTV